MRKLFAGFTAAAFVVVLGAPAFAKVETIKGELVDQTCYVKDHKNVGASHKECADTCAKKGQPVAVPDFTRGRWKTKPPLEIVKM